MKTYPVLAILCLTLLTTGCVDRKIRINAQTVQTKTEIAQLHDAIKNYNIDYGGELSGTSASIVKALIGANPRKVVYFEAPPKRIVADGSLLDVWGTPFRITILPAKFLAPSAIQISSAGPDRVFDTADDITVTKIPK